MSMSDGEGTRKVHVSAMVKSMETRGVHSGGADGRNTVEPREGICATRTERTEEVLDVKTKTSPRSEFPGHRQHSKSGAIPKVGQKYAHEKYRTEQQDQGSPENEPLKGQAIILHIACNKQDVVKRRFFCTIDEYMKWQFIIHSKNHLDQLNTMICKQEDAKLDSYGLLQAFGMSPSENLERLGTAVVELALKLEGISVKHLPISSNLVESVYKKIKDATIMQTFCHSEIINEAVFIAYLSRNSLKVNECLKTQCGITIPCDKMNIHEVVTLDPVLKKLYKMMHLEETVRQAVNEPDVCVDIKLVSNEVLCTISGPQNGIKSARTELEQLKKKLCKKRCHLCIKNVNAIAELNVVDYLDNVLHSKNMKCVVSQCRESMYVHGFNSQVLEQACKVIESTIIEKPIIVTKENSDIIEGFQSAARTDHPGLIVYHVESRQKLFVIGVKEFVNEFIGMIHQPRSPHSGSKEFVTRKVKVPNGHIFNFIRSSKHVGGCTTKNGIKLEFMTEEHHLAIQLKGSHSGVSDAILFISDQMKVFLMENYEIDDVRAIQNLSQDTERQLLQEFVTEHDVLLDMCTDHNSGLIEKVSWSPTDLCKRMCSWTDILNTRCVRLMSKTQTEDYDSYDIRFKSVSHSNNPASIKASKTSLIVGVPLWNAVCDEGIFQFDANLAEALRTIEKEGREEIMMLLHSSHVLNWPLKNFIRRIANCVVQWLLSAEKIPKLRTVILLAHDDHEYNTSRDTLNKVYKKETKGDDIKVLVVPGELNATKADVLVNTTGKDLDLSNGKVSKSLLKAAGKAMQTECLTDCPDGLKHGEIAVTSGYNLHCHKVFHIALDRYIKTGLKDMQSVQNIRKLVEDCLIKASQYGFESIAFPALGTGILQYPIDIVSSAMFEGVERFRSYHTGTTIKSVLFVIYPKNEKVMEVFKKNERILYKNLKVSKEKVNKVTSVFTVSGVSDNVKATIRHLHEVTDHAKTDPNEVLEITVRDVTRMIYSIWKKYYHGRLDRSQCEGTDFPYDDKVNALIVKGKRQAVDPLVDVINKQIKEIKSSSLMQIKVPHSDVYTAFKARCSEYSPDYVMHVYDYYSNMIYLCGEGDHVLAVANELNLELNGDEAGTDTDKKIDGVDDKLDMASNVVADKINIKEVQYMSKQSNSQSKEKEPQMLSTKLKDKKVSQKLESAGSIRNSPSMDSLEKGMAGMNFCDVPEAVVDLKNKQPIQEGALVLKPSETQLNGKNVICFRLRQIVLYIYEGDILKTHVDCIVNPANRSLSHEGGLAGIITRKAGKEVIEESADILKKKGVKHLPVASVVITGAGCLPYLSIMHAVGPCWYDYKLEKKHCCADDLCNTIVHCLHEAENNEYRTIALPMISSGLFGVPRDVCAAQYRIGLEKFLSITRNILQEIHFLDIRHDMVQAVQDEFAEHFTDKTPSDSSSHDVVDSTMKINVSTSKSENKSQATVEKREERKKDVKELDVGDAHLREKIETEHRAMKEVTNEDDTLRHTQTDKQFKNTARSKPRSLENEATLQETALNKGADQNGLEDCVICLDKIKKEKKLKCGHTFCTECIDSYFQVKPVCPTCGEVTGIVTGDQPYGTMEVNKKLDSVAGYKGYKTLTVTYHFPGGRQGPNHPKPGEFYRGISRTGYIPDTPKGQEICSMLKIAFKRRLIFTIGTSRTTGHQGVITWNDIHHKTDIRPDTQFGYPDETYLERVREELAAKGVCQPDVEFMKKLKNDANLPLKIFNST